MKGNWVWTVQEERVCLCTIPDPYKPGGKCKKQKSSNCEVYYIYSSHKNTSATLEDVPLNRYSLSKRKQMWPALEGTFMVHMW